jgi:hypothetical protein
MTTNTYTAEITLIENSSAGNPPKSFPKQSVRIETVEISHPVLHRDRTCPKGEEYPIVLLRSKQHVPFRRSLAPRLPQRSFTLRLQND